jgi:hypothetical protein
MPASNFKKRCPRECEDTMKRSFLWMSTLICGLTLLAGCGDSGNNLGSATPVPAGTPLVSGGAVNVLAVQNNTLNLATASDAILKFSAASTSSGAVTPAASILGPAGYFFGGVATDAAGNIYVTAINTSTSAPEILVYDASATGAATPTRTITSPSLIFPIGLTVDSAGSIYVADVPFYNNLSTASSIFVFAPQANGSSTPTRTIAGTATLLDQPLSLAVDTTGNLYVSDLNKPGITVFSSTATGNVAPARNISGSATGLIYGANGIALDTGNNIYVSSADATGNYGAVAEFAATSSGNVAPIKTVGGAQLGATQGLGGVQVDSVGNIYTVAVSGVTNSFFDIAAFAPSVSGNATPAFENFAAAFNSTGFGLIAIH